MAILRCTEAFTYWNAKGHPISVAPGDLVDDKDPAVKGREHSFESVEANVERRTDRSVEQATSAPGEKRATRKPPAKA